MRAKRLGRETGDVKARARRARPTPAAQTADGVADRDEAAADVADKICATLAIAIGNGVLKPGTKILEDAIADHFGVSRTVVRGALAILQRDHLLERRRNRGAFVAEPSIETAKQLFEARRALERTILEQVIERAETSDLERLGELTNEEKRVHDGADETAKRGLSGRFHVELAKLGGNGVLTELLGKVVARLSLVMALYESGPHDGCGADHHRAILAAVSKRDLNHAQELMEQHLDDIESRVRLIQAQGDRNMFVSMLEMFSVK